MNKNINDILENIIFIDNKNPIYKIHKIKMIKMFAETKTFAETKKLLKAYCENSNYSDWRLPTVDELETIHGKIDFINEEMAKFIRYDGELLFKGARGWYWSSTMYNGTNELYKKDFKVYVLHIGICSIVPVVDRDSKSKNFVCLVR